MAPLAILDVPHPVSVVYDGCSLQIPGAYLCAAYRLLPNGRLAAMSDRLGPSETGTAEPCHGPRRDLYKRDRHQSGWRPPSCCPERWTGPPTSAT